MKINQQHANNANNNLYSYYMSPPLEFRENGYFIPSNWTK